MNLKRIFDCAGRLARFWLAIARHFLFALSLAAGGLLTSAAHAQDSEVACEGDDLVKALAAENPALLERLRREAAETPNGKGLLWRIESTGDAPPSYLFGTMHVTDPRVVAMSEAAREAFGGARTIAVETTDILDEASMRAALAEEPELTMFLGDERLTDYLDTKERMIVQEGLAERGVPLQAVVKMKPWMLSSLISLPACELHRRESGAVMLDQKLAQEAHETGKNLVGLETAHEQLSAMASLPMELHMEALVGVLELGDGVEDFIETIMVLYLDGETGMFRPVLDRLLVEAGQNTDGYAEFDRLMIERRNEVMAERAMPLLEEGGAFIAVGAMHLPGERGLVALFREAGYEVQAIEE
ncbi:TraB/GumN family protein [Chelativorans sp. YIM 93263]|uniref:TraB/GumN family protein n=1 Tax=Chelativorans sp. YIM 93263 TaxID=2906648 RepID=UPI002378B6CF|nr:TraB/GumN family protein [Chelativorans sp. YIM 93263]